MPLTHQAFVDKFLVTLEHRQGVEPIFRGDIADRRQRVAIAEHAFEDHRDNAVAQLPIDRLIFIPFRVHLRRPVKRRRPQNEAGATTPSLLYSPL